MVSETPGEENPLPCDLRCFCCVGAAVLRVYVDNWRALMESLECGREEINIRKKERGRVAKEAFCLRKVSLQI